MFRRRSRIASKAQRSYPLWLIGVVIAGCLAGLGYWVGVMGGVIGPPRLLPTKPNDSSDAAAVATAAIVLAGSVAWRLLRRPALIRLLGLLIAAVAIGAVAFRIAAPS